MRGSRLLVTSSAGGAGRFCGRVLWRTGTGGVTEYEALMEDMRAGRDFTSPARNGSVWCYGDITGEGAPLPPFFNIGLEACLLTRHMVQ